MFTNPFKTYLSITVIINSILFVLIFISSTQDVLDLATIFSLLVLFNIASALLGWMLLKKQDNKFARIAFITNITIIIIITLGEMLDLPPFKANF